eukprot:85292-Rhodomonas_salina.1
MRGAAPGGPRRIRVIRGHALLGQRLHAQASLGPRATRHQPAAGLALAAHRRARGSARAWRRERQHPPSCCPGPALACPRVLLLAGQKYRLSMSA